MHRAGGKILSFLSFCGGLANHTARQPAGEERLQFESSGRGFVMLQHKFDIEHKDGSHETRMSTLWGYGDAAGYWAMAKLCGHAL